METIPNYPNNWSFNAYDDRLFSIYAVVDKRNQRVSSMRVTYMVAAAVGKTISIIIVRPEYE